MNIDVNVQRIKLFLVLHVILIQATVTIHLTLACRFGSTANTDSQIDETMINREPF